MSPFLNYEVAKGRVEEMRVGADRRRRWRTVEKEGVSALPSWDARAIELLATASNDEQEMVGA